MLLLSDGSVLAQNGEGTNWYKLNPTNGSYLNGNWAPTNTINPMHYTRLYYSSAVLRDGRVFVAGGEYGTGTTNAEVYDPCSNIWTVIPVPPGLISTNNTNSNPSIANNAGFLDSGCVTLPGRQGVDLTRQPCHLRRDGNFRSRR